MYRRPGTRVPWAPLARQVAEPEPDLSPDRLPQRADGPATGRAPVSVTKAVFRFFLKHFDTSFREFSPDSQKF